VLSGSVGQKGVACVGESYLLAAISIQKSDAEFLLQGLDLTAQWRLAEMQALGRSPEGKFLGCRAPANRIWDKAYGKIGLDFSSWSLVWLRSTYCLHSTPPNFGTAELPTVLRTWKNA
jgi:hypothetical protein